ncbi:MAG TPA: glycosyltransferase family 4 protein, partial [Treponemataceae bacterium]|nr:glycosyltransferase family 4 protein [Treponemataceae bacterium]
NGVNGWAIKNDKELWDKAVKVLENDGTRIAMGLKSKELSLNYSINRFVESMIEIYSSYIKK